MCTTFAAVAVFPDEELGVGSEVCAGTVLCSAEEWPICPFSCDTATPISMVRILIFVRYIVNQKIEYHG